MKCCAKVAGYFRRAGGVNPLVTLLSQIGKQLHTKVTRVMTDPARLKLVIRPHSGECSYNLFALGESVAPFLIATKI